MKNLLSVIAICLLFVSCTPEVKTVHVKGELKNFASEFMMAKQTPVGKILKEGVKITLDEQNKFDVTFELDQPAYFQLGRNTLYLTPGDELELLCDKNKPNAGKFTGEAAEACDYLKSKPFPKGGSYMTGPGNVLVDNPLKELVRERIIAKVIERQLELADLKNVSKKFVKMEKGRIQFDAANSFMMYSFYGAHFAKVQREEMQAFADESNAFFKEDIDKYCAHGGDADYLNIEAYFQVVDRCIEVMGKENVDQAVFDFLKAYELNRNLGSQSQIASILVEKQKVIASLKTQEYIDAIEKAFKKYDEIMPGKMADDLNMKTREGVAVSLSDFKGKIVVVDVWATWCGPCKRESPFFEKLAEKYKDNSNLKFISISIDSNLKAWENYLAKHEKVSEQLICNRTEFEKYILQGIPRFMVIGKKGEIIDVFAPKPSDPEFENLLQKHI